MTLKMSRFGLSILLLDIITLPDVTSYDKFKYITNYKIYEIKVNNYQSKN